VCINGLNQPCVQQQQCDVDPENTPAGKNATMLCDTVTTHTCLLLGNQSCSPLFEPSICASGTCRSNACTCNNSAQCNPNTYPKGCNATTNVCSSCIVDGDCSGTTPKCNTTYGVCVQACTSPAQCTISPYVACNTTDGLCTQIP
jgi:hypothetical protein